MTEQRPGTATTENRPAPDHSPGPVPDAQAARSGIDTKALGATIRRRRKAAELSVNALQKAASVPTGQVSRLENAKIADPSSAYLLRIARVLNTTVDELLGGTGPAQHPREGGGSSETAGAGAEATAGQGLRVLPAHALAPSPLNPRRRFDKDGLAELAGSIRAVGVLEPLLARPAPKDHPDAAGFELVAGERRWRAAATIDRAFELPVIVREIADDDVVEIALVENLQREDLDPLDEAETFRFLNEERGVGTDDIAARIGKTRRYVQQRIALVKRLSPKVQEALAAGAIDLAKARVLSLTADTDRQEEIVARLIDWQERGHTVTADQLREDLTDELPPLGWAIFDRNWYDGEIIPDEQESDPVTGGGWFADAAQAEKLQRVAIDHKLAELKEKYAWATLHHGWFSRHDYVECPKNRRAEAGAVIAITGRLGVTIHENIIERQHTLPGTEAGKGSPHPEPVREPCPDGEADPGTDTGPEFTQKHLISAKVIKSRRIQQRIENPDPGAEDEATRIAKALVVYGLRVSTWDRNFTTISPGHATGPDAEVLGRPDDIGTPPTKAIRDLLALPAEDVDRLFRAAVSRRVGIFPGYTPRLEDPPAAGDLAAALGVDMAADFTIDEDYLATLGKPALINIILDNELEPEDEAGLAKRTMPALRDTILEAVAAGRMKPGYVPIELRFHAPGNDPGTTEEGDQ